MIRIVPWQIKEYRQKINSPKSGQEPYRPLTESDRLALQRLANAIVGAGPKSEQAYPNLAVQYESYPSTLTELRQVLGSTCRPSEIFSLTDEEDKVESYGLLKFDCPEGDQKVEKYVSVALKSAQPVRVYLGGIRPVYAASPSSVSPAGSK